MGFRSSGVVLGLLGFRNNGCQDNSCSQEDQVGDMQPHDCMLPGKAWWEGNPDLSEQPCTGSAGPVWGGTHWQVPGRENQMFPEGVLFSLLSSLFHGELSSSSSALAATFSILLLMESLSLLDVSHPALSGCSSRPTLPHACCPSLLEAETWADGSPPARRAAAVAQPSPYQ